MDRRRTLLRSLAGALLLAGLGMGAHRASAAGTVVTYKVTTAADDPAATNCNATGIGANCSLRGAINDADSGPAPAIYNIIVPGFHIVLVSANGSLTIDNSDNTTINIKGSGPGTTLIDDASQGDQIFVVNTPASFQNLTIENAGNDNADLEGAGLFSTSTVAINRVTFANNNAGTSGDGGAIYAAGGRPVSISNSVFTGNFAQDGGALYLSGESVTGHAFTSIQSSTFTRNSACNADPCTDSDVGDGGAIYLDQGNLTVNLSNLNHNQAGSLSSGEGEGGALYNSGGYGQVNSSSLLSNVAGYEGGGLVDETVMAVNNSTIGGNTSGTDGGGVYEDNYGFYNGDIITGNTVGGSVSDEDGSGGGMYINYPTVVANTNFQGNKALDANGTIAPVAGVAVHAAPISHHAKPVTNQATGTCGSYGGGLYNNDHTTMTNVTFVSNQACDGGGLYTDDTSYPLTLNASRFISNLAGLDGGAMYVDGTPAETLLNNVQVTINKALGQTGGVWNSSEGDVVLTGPTKLFGNIGGSCPNLTQPCS